MDLYVNPCHDHIPTYHTRSGDQEPHDIYADVVQSANPLAMYRVRLQEYNIQYYRCFRHSGDNVLSIKYHNTQTKLYEQKQPRVSIPYLIDLIGLSLVYCAETSGV